MRGKRTESSHSVALQPFQNQMNFRVYSEYSEKRSFASGHLQLSDVTTGNHLKTFTAHTEKVSSPCFSPDGPTLATDSENGTVLKVFRLTLPDDCAKLHYMPNTKYL